ncbi:MAG: ethanolamine permease [Cyanosarcina radialis HA8281-LM2]|jgi:ethanolamine permease|nr:ethanolamine permease [Cyanosarcina radialis HA8281-LM2]
MQINTGLVGYEKVPKSYTSQRRLEGKANSWLLWSLGVGAVIGGEFFGWNGGLASGGFGGLAIATILMALMYICMVYSIAEMSASLPHAGGFYSFTRSAFGPLAGFICGITLIIEYVLTVATTVVSLSDYLNPLVPGVPNWAIWLFAYAIFVAINIWGMGPTLNVSLYLCLAAILMLCIFFVTTLGAGTFHPELLFNIPPTEGNSIWLPFGWQGVFAAIPYAIWFYLAIEQLPMAAEETHNVPQNMPKGLIWGIFTLIVLSLLVLVLNSGVGGGALEMGKTLTPLGDGLEVYYRTSNAINIVLLCGIISTFHSITYAYGRAIFALSRAGYIPRWISVTGKTNTPYRALILGAIIGLICAVLISVVGGDVGKVLLNMSVFGAVISYIMVMFGYIKLKLDRPQLPRPYQSPLGLGGAIVGALLAVFALFACMSIPAYQPGIIGIAVVLLAATVYFWFYSRHKLVAQAPEERAALLAERQG